MLVSFMYWNNIFKTSQYRALSKSPNSSVLSNLGLSCIHRPVSEGKDNRVARALVYDGHLKKKCKDVSLIFGQCEPTRLIRLYVKRWWFNGFSPSLNWVSHLPNLPEQSMLYGCRFGRSFFSWFLKLLRVGFCFRIFGSAFKNLIVDGMKDLVLDVSRVGGGLMEFQHKE